MTRAIIGRAPKQGPIEIPTIDMSTSLGNLHLLAPVLTADRKSTRLNSSHRT